MTFLSCLDFIDPELVGRRLNVTDGVSPSLQVVLKELSDLGVVCKVKRGSRKFEQTGKHEHKWLEEEEESNDVLEAFLEKRHLVRDWRIHFEHSEDLEGRDWEDEEVDDDDFLLDVCLLNSFHYRFLVCIHLASIRGFIPICENGLFRIQGFEEQLDDIDDQIKEVILIPRALEVSFGTVG